MAELGDFDDDDSVKDANYAEDDDSSQAAIDALDDMDIDEDVVESETEVPAEAEIGEDGPSRLNDFNFVRIIEMFGKCLLDKAQTPAMKKKKKHAWAKVVSECLSLHGCQLSEQQAKRKLDNLKARVKVKVDRKKTGNIPITLNEADNLLLTILDAQENPSITQLPRKHLFHMFKIVAIHIHVQSIINDTIMN